MVKTRILVCVIDGRPDELPPLTSMPASPPEDRGVVRMRGVRGVPARGLRAEAAFPGDAYTGLRFSVTARSALRLAVLACWFIMGEGQQHSCQG